MTNNKGFTVIELMIVVAILCIALVIGFTAFQAIRGSNDGITWSIVGGMQQTTCISGYRFTVNQRGYTTQILGADGKPLPCN